MAGRSHWQQAGGQDPPASNNQDVRAGVAAAAGPRPPQQRPGRARRPARDHQRGSCRQAKPTSTWFGYREAALDPQHGPRRPRQTARGGQIRGESDAARQARALPHQCAGGGNASSSTWTRHMAGRSHWQQAGGQDPPASHIRDGRAGVAGRSAHQSAPCALPLRP